MCPTGLILLGLLCFVTHVGLDHSGQYFWFPHARVFAQHVRKLQSSVATDKDAEIDKTQRLVKGLIEYTIKTCGSNPIARK